MRRLLFISLFVCFWCLFCEGQAVQADPVLKSSLALGTAQKGAEFRSGARSGLMGELKLSLTGRDLGGFMEWRHAFHDVSYLERKSRIKWGLDLFVAPTASLFCEFERSYYIDDDWIFAGVRFDLVKLFGG